MAVDDLRAGAGTDELLVRFTDLLALFIERIRNAEDQYFVTPADLRRPTSARAMPAHRAQR